MKNKKLKVWSAILAIVLVGQSFSCAPKAKTIFEVNVDLVASAISSLFTVVGTSVAIASFVKSGQANSISHGKDDSPKVKIILPNDDTANMQNPTAQNIPLARTSSSCTSYTSSNLVETKSSDFSLDISTPEFGASNNATPLSNLLNACTDSQHNLVGMIQNGKLYHAIENHLFCITEKAMKLLKNGSTGSVATSVLVPLYGKIGIGAETKLLVFYLKDELDYGSEVEDFCSNFIKQLVKDEQGFCFHSTENYSLHSMEGVDGVSLSEGSFHFNCWDYFPSEAGDWEKLELKYGESWDENSRKSARLVFDLINCYKDEYYKMIKYSQDSGITKTEPYFTKFPILQSFAKEISHVDEPDLFKKKVMEHSKEWEKQKRSRNCVYFNPGGIEGFDERYWGK